MQECFASHDSAKQLGSIVAGDSSRKWAQSLSVASGQNLPPMVAARIAPIEFHCVYLCLHSTLVLLHFALAEPRVPRFQSVPGKPDPEGAA